MIPLRSGTHQRTLTANCRSSVNGADVGDISFAGTGAWVGTYADATMNVSIPSNATVTLFYDAGDSAMKYGYDYF